MKKIIVVCVIALMLAGCGANNKSEAKQDVQSSVVQESNTETDNAADSSVDSEKADTKDSSVSTSSKEEEAVMLETEGDVEIVIPDDQESAGE